MKEFFNRDPGPGTYTNSTAESSIMGSTTSTTSNIRGFLNGFVSKSDRFKELPID